ncbi:MAG: 50S ribosomal protein L4 [Dehalococcoidia bacterium]|nr:MAG: 50S ribosomal protein L4 [Dehalococcoidia bacterium]
MFPQRRIEVVKVPVHNIQGEVVDHIALKDEIFGVPPNQAVVHQALVRQLANARQGTASTKTRAQVSGGGRKPFRQKGTGRARRGSASSPLLRGGGVAFGPHPRSYRQAMPRKMRSLALRCVLSAKVAQGEMVVVDEIALNEPKTKEMARILAALGVGSSVLIVTAGADPNAYKSARNLERTKTLPANLINVGDLLSHRILMLTVAAVRRVEEMGTPQPRKMVETQV